MNQIVVVDKRLGCFGFLYRLILLALALFLCRVFLDVGSVFWIGW